VECQPFETLLEWAEGRLDPSAAALGHHVKHCLVCQMNLDQITDDADLRRRLDARKRIGFATIDPVVMGRIVDQFPSAKTLRQNADRGFGGAPPCEARGIPESKGDLGTIGQFRLLSELGRGGMGIVYRAWDESLRRVVALKVLRPERCEEVDRLRLIREAQLAARFRDDHAVNVYSVVNPEGGLPYLVMEYVEGPTLSELIASRDRPDTRRIASLIAEVASALEAAHAVGLIHRDVKPSNILIDLQTGRAKITDFGLARASNLSSSLSRDGLLAGTPTYMSPEQARGEPGLDGRTDVYSLGATLYEALTGMTPYRGAPHLVLRQIIEEDPRPPRLLNDQIPRDLETICLKAMAREPARRYQTAGALADDLRRWLRHESIQARPVSRAERAYRWCRRNPRVAGLAAALLVVFLMGFLGVLWQWRRAELHLKESQASFARARRAVDQFYTRFYEKGVLNVPGMEKVRHEVLGEMLQYYQDFLAEHRDDPSLRRELAETCSRIGSLTYQQANKADALIVIRQATSYLDTLLTVSPHDRELQKRMAACLGNLAAIEIDQRDLESSRLHFERAVRLLEPASNEEPDNHELRCRLGRLHGNLAKLLWTMNDMVQARTRYLQTMDIQKELLRKNPANLEYKSDLAMTCNNLYYVSDGPLEKQAWCEKALTLRKELVLVNPGNNYFQRNLARTYEIFGITQLAGNHHEDGLKSLEEGRRILQQVVVNEPVFKLAQDNLASLCATLGMALRNEGRIQEAIAAFDQSRATYQKLLQVSPDDAGFKGGLSMAEHEIALTAQKKKP
jgi:eukaryotic-like serine/threonine-protein kinase